VPEPALVLVGRPAPLAHEGVVGAGAGQRPEDVGRAGLGQPGAQRAAARQGPGDPALVGVPGLLPLPVHRRDLRVRVGRRRHDLGQGGDAVADPGGDAGQQGNLPLRVGLALHGPPVFPVPQRDPMIVPHRADVQELGEDRPLGAEDGVNGGRGHVGRLGDGGHGRDDVAIADEQRLRGVEDAPPGRQGLAFPPAGPGLDGLAHLSRVSLY
jgi:hypothetical protein